MSGDDPYVYPGSDVLINRLGLTDQGRLDYVERELVAQRMAEGIPRGVFDLRHLRAIHRHLFQALYEWAGELRTAEISKSGSQFQFRQFIETGMEDVHRRLNNADFLRDLSAPQFASAAGVIMGDVNYVHPFRKVTAAPNSSILRCLPTGRGTPSTSCGLSPSAGLRARDWPMTGIMS